MAPNINILLESFNDFLRLARGFRRDVVRLSFDPSIYAITVMSAGSLESAKRIELFLRPVRVILLIRFEAGEADVTELLSLSELSRDGDTQR